jgi:hypothetical protein
MSILLEEIIKYSSILYAFGIVHDDIISLHIRSNFSKFDFGRKKTWGKLK